jgi:hypothetical protein
LPKNIATTHQASRDGVGDQPRLPYRRPKITRIGAGDAPYLSRDERDDLLAMVPRQLHAVLDAHFTVGRTGEVWATRDELAARAGVPERTFNRHRARLVALGVLTLVWHSARARDGQPGRPARYRLIRPADVVPAAVEAVEPPADYQSVGTAEPEQAALARCRWCMSADHDHDDCPNRALTIVRSKLDADAEPAEPDETRATMAHVREQNHGPLWLMIDAQTRAKVARRALEEPPYVSKGGSVDSSSTRASPDDPDPTETVGIETPNEPARRAADDAWLAKFRHDNGLPA